MLEPDYISLRSYFVKMDFDEWKSKSFLFSFGTVYSSDWHLFEIRYQYSCYSSCVNFNDSFVRYQ